MLLTVFVEHLVWASGKHQHCRPWPTDTESWLWTCIIHTALGDFFRLVPKPRPSLEARPQTLVQFPFEGVLCLPCPFLNVHRLMGTSRDDQSLWLLASLVVSTTLNSGWNLGSDLGSFAWGCFVLSWYGWRAGDSLALYRGPDLSSLWASYLFISGTSVGHWFFLNISVSHPACHVTL